MKKLKHQQQTNAYNVHVFFGGIWMGFGWNLMQLFLVKIIE
jgi:hypothetical protein